MTAEDPEGTAPGKSDDRAAASASKSPRVHESPSRESLSHDSLSHDSLSHDSLSQESLASGVSGSQANSAGFASVERAFLRLTFWQTLLSLAGVFTGAVALYAALGESQAVRQQTAATVWPYVQVTINNHLSEEAASFSLEVSNVGVGPARMRGMTVRINGMVQTDWVDVLATLLGESAAADVDYGRSSVGRRVLAPQESVTLFSTSDRTAVQAMQAAVFAGQSEIVAGRVSLGYCYCSIFDACWQVEIQQDAEPEPQPVEQCPRYPESAFSH